MRFVVDEVAMKQVSLQFLQSYPANHHCIIAPHLSITASFDVPQP
jgi:hypothetical protein